MLLWVYAQGGYECNRGWGRGASEILAGSLCCHLTDYYCHFHLPCFWLNEILGLGFDSYIFLGIKLWLELHLAITVQPEYS